MILHYIALTISRTKTCCRRFPFRNNSDFLHLIDQLDLFFCSNSCLSSACPPKCLNHHIRFYIQQWTRAALFLGCFFHLFSSAWTLLNIKTQFLRARESVDYEIFILHLRWCSSEDFPFSYFCSSSLIFFLAVEWTDFYRNKIFPFFGTPSLQWIFDTFCYIIWCFLYLIFAGTFICNSWFRRENTFFNLRCI